MVLFGENPALEAGDSNAGEGWDATKICFNNTIKGDTANIWLSDEVKEEDLIQYKFPTQEEFNQWGGRGIFMGYYLNWSGWENGIYAIQQGMRCIKADYRDIGVHYTHNSLDSNNSGIVNSMLKQIKLGFGNATEFACYDVRSNRITRNEAAVLARELDGGCHIRYIRDYCDWIGVEEKVFWEVVETYRGHMWRQEKLGHWKLIEPIWEQIDTSNVDPVENIIDRLNTERIAKLRV